VQTIVHCFCFGQKLECWTSSSLHPQQVAHADSYPHPEQVAHKRMFGGFMLADISLWDMFASGGAFSYRSVVVCETFASPDLFASSGAFNSVSVVVWERLASPDNALG
jgi:hypothetical protein